MEHPDDEILLNPNLETDELNEYYKQLNIWFENIHFSFTDIFRDTVFTE